MANLNETDDFPAGIYQLEDTDPVKGGAPNEATKAGVDNIPHQQLARRTRWLKTRVDTLVSTVVAATTAVAGIVRLTDSVTSTSTTTAATANAAKAANDNANLRAHKTTTIDTAGLATGGGDLSANRTITVADATQAEAEAGTITTRAMSPMRVAQAILVRMAARSITTSGLATGGGDLSANRTITVTDASQAEAEAGSITTRAMSPLRVSQAIAARLADQGLPIGVTVSDLDAAISGVATGGAVANSPIANPVALTLGRDATNRAQVLATSYASVPRLFLRNKQFSGGYTDWSEAWLGRAGDQSLAASGYQRLPSGLLIQWGQFTGTTSASLTNNGIFESDLINVTWPVAFTALYQVIPGASVDVSGYGQQEQVWRRGATLTGGSFAVASRTSGATMTGSYLVIGV